MTDDILRNLLRQRAELDQRITAEQERGRNDYDRRIARLDDALHDYARERQLPLERSSRKNAAIYTVDGVAVQWIDEVDSDDLPPTPVVVHDTVASVRAQFDTVPPTAALIGLIEGLRTSRS